ncbi:MAG: LptF/LptG family permease [Bacteroidales bacterium]|nr:LptF/LptG family permease [Bacteroidales bacterium]
MRKYLPKTIDMYIIRKFLGTFFFALLIIIAIAVVFDISEKIDDFIENKASLREVVFDYYFNFIPYFSVLFSSLFTFIAVIFFTSKMAYNTEIIAILSSGMSYKRFLVPYFISALFIAIFSFVISNYVLPPANKVRLDFEEKYLHHRAVSYNETNIHKQLEPGLFIYMETYSNVSDIGYKFSMERYNENNNLVSKLSAAYIKWDSTINKWNLKDYVIRDIKGMDETITTGSSLDTTLVMQPEDFKRRFNFIETMSIGQLNDFIRQQELQGEEGTVAYIIERDKRLAFPFSTFILTMMGVFVSSRKVRGGMGAQIGVGLLVCFSYILFMQFSSQFAIGGSLSPLIAAWIPNIIFFFVALMLYRFAPK